MIHVDRNRIDGTGHPIKPNAHWFALARKATRQAIRQGEKHKTRESVYAHSEVRKALEALFHDKCAYCETKITAPSDWDVEHFRPKGSVAEADDHPGYYWLAYSWENLYASCQHCNQRRKDRPRWTDSSQLTARGKADQFPLIDESNRATSPEDDITKEAPLVVDPCRDDPEEHLGYDMTGEVFSLSGNPRGRATIDVLHLSRRRLKDARIQIVAAVSHLLTLISSDRLPTAALTDLQGLLDKHYKADDCQYAGVARYVAGHAGDFVN